MANWRGDTLDLLPACYDEWLIFERERIRQRLLHALEALSRRLVAFGRPADAVDAAMWAVSADPVRESANRILIEAHLAEGNLIEASRTYQRYRDIVRREARRGAQQAIGQHGASEDPAPIPATQGWKRCLG